MRRRRKAVVKEMSRRYYEGWLFDFSTQSPDDIVKSRQSSATGWRWALDSCCHHHHWSTYYNLFFCFTSEIFIFGFIFMLFLEKYFWHLKTTLTLFHFHSHFVCLFLQFVCPPAGSEPSLVCVSSSSSNPRMGFITPGSRSPRWECIVATYILCSIWLISRFSVYPPVQLVLPLPQHRPHPPLAPLTCLYNGRHHSDRFHEESYRSV